MAAVWGPKLSPLSYGALWPSWGHPHGAVLNASHRSVILGNRAGPREGARSGLKVALTTGKALGCVLIPKTKVLLGPSVSLNTPIFP